MTKINKSRLHLKKKKYKRLHKTTKRLKKRKTRRLYYAGDENTSPASHVESEEDTVVMQNVVDNDPRIYEHETYTDRKSVV